MADDTPPVSGQNTDESLKVRRPEERMLNAGATFRPPRPFDGASDRRGRKWNRHRDYTTQASIDEVKQLRNLFGTPANAYRHLHLDHIGVEYTLFLRFWSWRPAPQEIVETIQRMWNIWKYKYLIIPRDFYLFRITQEDIDNSYSFDYANDDARREAGWHERFAFPELLG